MPMYNNSDEYLMLYFLALRLSFGELVYFRTSLCLNPLIFVNVPYQAKQHFR